MNTVSIIIPCYNCEKYIEDAINSALNQTFKDIEIVCINDGSNDNSVKIIENLSKTHKNIKFIDNKINQGVVKARNQAIKESKGEYILPLDADDIIEETYIEKAAEILDKNPNIGMVYCKAKLFGNINQIWKLPNIPNTVDDLLFENKIFATALFRKSDFIKAGCYKEYMQYGYEDWELWLSFFELGLKAYKIDEFLFNYRQHNDETRNINCKKYDYIIRKQMLTNHLNSYLNNEEIVRGIFENSQKLKSKYKRYKQLFFLMLFATLIELIIILF